MSVSVQLSLEQNILPRLPAEVAVERIVALLAENAPIGRFISEALMSLPSFHVMGFQALRAAAGAALMSSYAENGRAPSLVFSRMMLSVLWFMAQSAAGGTPALLCAGRRIFQTALATYLRPEMGASSTRRLHSLASRTLINGVSHMQVSAALATTYEARWSQFCPADSAYSTLGAALISNKERDMNTLAGRARCLTSNFPAQPRSCRGGSSSKVSFRASHTTISRRLPSRPSMNFVAYKYNSASFTFYRSSNAARTLALFPGPCQVRSAAGFTNLRHFIKHRSWRRP